MLTGLLAAIVLGLVACDDAAAPSNGPIHGHPPTLAGTSWVIVSVAGQRPAPGVSAAMAFDATRVQGNGGCNGYGGGYRYERLTGELRFDAIGMTAMACVEAPKMMLEGRLMQALGSANRATVDGNGAGELVLSGPGGDIVLAAIAPSVTD